MPKGKGYKAEDVPRGSGLFDRAARSIMGRKRANQEAMQGKTSKGVSKRDMNRGYSKPDGD